MVGLVLEGGGQRCMYSAAIIDAMMQHGITVDGIVGVSAGSAFGVNMKSGQMGRALRYNKKFCNDPRYTSLKALITTGNLYTTDFCYGTVPRKLDVFDTDAFTKSPIKYWSVCTDVRTAEPVYLPLTDGGDRDMRIIQASASMPLVSNVIDVDDMLLLDGGISDSIPLKWMQEQGYDKNVVILTQVKGYRKERSRIVPLLCRLLLRKYPAIADALARRHEMYNAQIDYVLDQERKGNIFLIQPKVSTGISRIERNPEKLQQQYDLGAADAQALIPSLREFIIHNS